MGQEEKKIEIVQCYLGNNRHCYIQYHDPEIQIYRSKEHPRNIHPLKVFSKQIWIRETDSYEIYYYLYILCCRIIF